MKLQSLTEVLQILLQVMDDGKITGTRKVVDFTNVVLLMTSNLGATKSEELKIGFGDQTRKGESTKAIKTFFSPEFRNRLDAVVEFNKLENGQMLMIVDRLVYETNQLLKNKCFPEQKLKLPKQAREQLALDGYEPAMGARPLKRVFEEKIKKPLSRKILFDDLNDCTITIEYVAEKDYYFETQC